MNIKGENPIIIIPRKNGSVFFSIVNSKYGSRYICNTIYDIHTPWRLNYFYICSSDKWDNKFFGISDYEAGWMDPQQCLALEVTYSALEDGGFTKEKLKGTDTGVYIGKF